MRTLAALFVSLTCLCLPLPAFAQAAAAAIPVKVVIVTTFENGADTGDKPGEFQFWVEREHLDRVLPFPGGTHDLRTNADGSVLGIVTGMTIGPAAASIMALGLDPRFDLTHAYWLLAGIAGVDPHVASVGSAAWAKWIVTDIREEMDPREAPPDWPYGIFAIGSLRAGEPPDPARVWGTEPRAYALNAKLADWAFALTKSTPLLDTPEIAAFRATFTGFPNAQRTPFVLEGDTLASDSYWHGRILTQWAEDWVHILTHGQGCFTMTAMEDSGIAEALQRLDAMHRADFRRFLDLRTASNYSMQAPGHTAAESITAPYIGGIPALEAAWRVGSPVLHTLTAHWDQYQNHIPGD
ncbi:MAG TPA: purine nucleoside permease [Acidobacteriaceae bacterium]|jgi:purine nucleoside permease|nr:purine nucleoside permease [Acidobacteriaceae bacterium]